MVTAPWRRTLVFVSLCVPVMLLGGGCKTSSGWRAPWSGWGWSGASSPSATALNISKPSTQAPAPTNVAGQNSRSLAGGSSANGASGVATVGATSPAGVAAYPATAHADAHPANAAGTWQPDAGAGEVAPAGGYQVGPYGMQQQNRSGYANAPRNSPAAGATDPRTSVPSEGGYGGTEGYRTADQQPPDSRILPPSVDQPASIYDEATGAATATEPSIYDGPTGETSPAEDVGAGASGPYSGGENPAESAAPRNYGPPNTVPPSTRPNTTPPAASGSARAPLPQSLSTNGGYRPGSTNGSRGVRSESFEEEQNAAAPQDSPTGGPMYR